MTVITTCSPYNFDLAKSLNSDYVFDYKSPTAIADVQEAAARKLGHILDCIGVETSAKFYYDVMDAGGGKYCSLLFPISGDQKDIQVAMVIAYTAYGSKFRKFGRGFLASQEDFGLTAESNSILLSFMSI